METKIITGKIWEDWYDELVIRNGDTDIDIENLFKYYEGKNVKITIEIIPEVENDDSEEVDEITWQLLFGNNSSNIVNRGKELGLI